MKNLETKNKREILKAKIDLPKFKLEVVSEDVSKSLGDIRRIVECLYNEEIIVDAPVVDDYLKFELSTQLSDEMINNKDALKMLKNKLELGESYKISRVVIKGIKEIDLINKTGELKISNISITNSIKKLFKDVDHRNISDCIIHIKGCNEEDKNLLIIDKINELIPQANIKAFNSNAVLDGKIIVETIMFGDF